MVFGAHNEFLVHCEQVRVFFLLLSLPVTLITIYKNFKQKVYLSLFFSSVGHTVNKTC